MIWDKKAQLRLASEQGTIQKDWGGRLPIALIYPNTYYIGMSNLGFHTIYGLLNSYNDIVCERVFYEGNNTSIESGRPLDDFAIIAFSISSELDYFNIVDILRSTAIPLSASERDDSHPMVIAGGPCITANPEPISPFFDCLAIGEGEAMLPSLIGAFNEGIDGSRAELLERLNRLPGIYVPSLFDGKAVSRQWIRDIDEFATTSVILTPHTELGNMYLIEIARGCRWGCRFCLAGFCYRPPRFRSVDKLLSQAERGMKYTKKIGLLGASPLDHPDIDKLVVELQRMGAEMSISSLRIRPLSRVALRGLVESGTQTLSLAPEAGSQRLRNIINKGVSQEDITNAIEWVAEHPPRQLKLYFMIGLPTETAEDIEEMIDLVLALKNRLNRGRTSTHLILTIEPFVPKAGTPFQRLPMASTKALRQRLARLKSSLEPKGIEIRSESIPWAEVQGVLSRGDDKLAAVLAQVAANGAKRSLSKWKQALLELSLDADQYIGRRIPPNERLPWDHIDLGVKQDYLERELERAFLAEESPPCPEIECHKCGVC